MQKLEFDVTCPGCNRSFVQRVEDIRPGKSRNCPHCGATFNFTGDDGSRVQRALDDFERSIKRLTGN